MAGKNLLKLSSEYEAANLMAASIIAADPQRYQGLMSEWADRVLSVEEKLDDSEAGPLFAAA